MRLKPLDQPFAPDEFPPTHHEMRQWRQPRHFTVHHVRNVIAGAPQNFGHLADGQNVFHIAGRRGSGCSEHRHRFERGRGKRINILHSEITSHELSAYALADIEQFGRGKTGNESLANFCARDFRCAPAASWWPRTGCGRAEFSRDFGCGDGGRARDFGCALYGTLGAASLFTPVVDQVEIPVIRGCLCVKMWISWTTTRDPDGFAQVEGATTALDTISFQLSGIERWSTPESGSGKLPQSAL
jgi:hypothetical protein